MENDVYKILLSASGALIILLLGIIVSSSLTIFRNVSILLTVTERIKTLLSERNTSCVERHDRINHKLNCHSIKIDSHDKEISILKSKIT